MDYSRTSALPFSFASSTAAGWATVAETLWMIPSMPFGNPSPASGGGALAQRARITTELLRTQSKPVDDLSSFIIYPVLVVHTTTQLFSNSFRRANSFRRPFLLECAAGYCPGNRFFSQPCSLLLAATPLVLPGLSRSNDSGRQYSLSAAQHNCSQYRT